MIFALILAVVSAILSLITPNKLSDITDTITKGIAPNSEKFEKIGKEISSNLSDKEKMMAKSQLIMTSPDISLEDKSKFMEIIQKMDKKNNRLLELPDSILLIIFDDIKVDNVTISSKDQIKTLRVMAKMDTQNPEKALKSFDK